MAIGNRPRRRFPDAGRSHLRPLPGDTRELYRQPDEPVELIRHEEEAEVTTAPQDAGKVRLRKRVSSVMAKVDVRRLLEDSEVEHRPVEAGDSGEVETLPDGSVSIPIFEEEVVVTKRMVVRERLIVRKVRRTEQVTVPLELKRERIGIEADESVRDRIRGR
jgi:uncharacterized protein (TIGR02271 family)